MNDSDSEKIEQLRQDYLDHRYKNYPKPENEAEQEFYDRTLWTDKSQFSIFVDGEQVQ